MLYASKGHAIVFEWLFSVAFFVIGWLSAMQLMCRDREYLITSPKTDPDIATQWVEYSSTTLYGNEETIIRTLPLDSEYGRNIDLLYGHGFQRRNLCLRTPSSGLTKSLAYLY